MISTRCVIHIYFYFHVPPPRRSAGGRRARQGAEVHAARRDEARAGVDARQGELRLEQELRHDTIDYG